MTNFYAAPDSTDSAQTASIYKSNIDNALAVHNRKAGDLQVAAQASPNMTVRYTAGSIQNGTTLTEIVTGSTGTITAPSVNPRIDRVVVDQSTGAVSIITGAEAASPSPPAITSGKVVLAQIALATSTTQITAGLITPENAGILATSNSGMDLDITGMTAESSIADADEIPIYDATAAANRKMQRGDLLAGQAVGNINIAGATDLGAQPDDADEVMINDGGVNKKANYADFMLGSHGAWKYLGTTVASATANVDITLTSGYDTYLIMAHGVTIGTDDKDVYVRFQTAGGAVRAGASDYAWSLQGKAGSTTSSLDDSSDTQIVLNDAGQGGMGSAAGEHFNLEIQIHSARTATLFTYCYGNLRGIAADSDVTMNDCGGYVKTAEDNDLVRILLESSATMTGSFELYGLKTS